MNSIQQAETGLELSGLEFITHVLLTADTIVEKAADHHRLFLHDAKTALEGLSAVGTLATRRQMDILEAVHEVWYRLAPEVTSPWDGEFMKWAENATDLAPSTISAKISTSRFWAEQKAEGALPEKVAVPVRERVGTRLVDTGEVKEVKLDLENIPESKLVYARGAQARREMTDDAYAALADPEASTRDLLRELKRARVTEEASEPVRVNGFRVSYFEGQLYAHTDEASVPFLSFETTGKLARQAAAHLLRMFGLDVPGEFIEPRRGRGHITSVFDEGRDVIVYSPDGLVEVYIDRRDFEQMYEIASEEWGIET
jgi:hypothetical protein